MYISEEELRDKKIQTKTKKINSKVLVEFQPYQNGVVLFSI